MTRSWWIRNLFWTLLGFPKIVNVMINALFYNISSQSKCSKWMRHSSWLAHLILISDGSNIGMKTQGIFCNELGSNTCYDCWADLKLVLWMHLYLHQTIVYGHRESKGEMIKIREQRFLHKASIMYNESHHKKHWMLLLVKG